MRIIPNIPVGIRLSICVDGTRQRLRLFVRVQVRNNQVNYAIKGSWSNLYNDVDVPFTPGTGFSIGTKANVTTLGGSDKVLFRLPKVDMSYKYYGNTTGEGNKTSLTHRTGNGRFHISPDEKGQNAVTSCPVSSTGGMFGNPFMSHLDMEKFLNGKSTNTYYIMTATGTVTNILGNEYSISTGDADPKLVAPLQSFIVKDLASATFNTGMIAKAPATGKPGLRSATSSPADESLPQLRITATRDGVAILPSLPVLSPHQTAMWRAKMPPC